MARQTNNEIQRLVDEFVAQLSVLVHQSALEVVREALGDTAAPAKRRGPGRPPKAKAAKSSKATGKRGRRSAEEVESLGKVVLTHVRAHPGQRLEEIGRALKIATKELKRPIANLLEAGALRTEGQRRGTKYFTGGGRKPAKPAKKAPARKKTASKRSTRKQAAKGKRRS